MFTLALHPETQEEFMENTIMQSFYDDKMKSLFTMLIDQLIIDYNEREVLKNVLQNNGTCTLENETGMTAEKIQRVLNSAINVFVLHLRDINCLIDENKRLRKELSSVESGARRFSDNDTLDNAQECSTINSLDKNSIPVSSLGVSPRLMHAFSILGISTLGEVNQHTWREYHRIPGVGAKTLQELKTLCWKYDSDIPRSPKQTSPKQIQVEDLPYNRWVKNALIDNGINTLADCTTLTEQEMYSILGRKNITKRIKNKLNKYGLSYKPIVYEVNGFRFESV